MTETALGIDTNLFIRQAARRMLGACCERTRTRIYVPGQTLREAPEKIRTLYGRAAARMSARTRPGETEGARKQRTLATLEAMCAGFVKWMHEEGKRNDGIYQYGQARGMAPEVWSLADWIGTSGAVDDRSDALIIAECLQRRTMCVSGDIPPEVWNRLGRTLLPKLRGGAELTLGVEFSATVEGGRADGLVADLGLSDRMEIR